MKTYKNFLPDAYFDRLNKIISSNEFQWYFSNRTLYKIVNENPENFMFTHKLCDYKKEKAIHSEWFQIFYPIIYFLNPRRLEYLIIPLIQDHPRRASA